MDEWKIWNICSMYQKYLQCYGDVVEELVNYGANVDGEEYGKVHERIHSLGEIICRKGSESECG